MIVNCPACGTPASIEPAYFGKKLRCANPACRQTFRVSPDGAVQMELGRPEAPRTYDWQQASPEQASGGTGANPEGQQQADWLSAPPPGPGERRAYPQPAPTYQDWQSQQQPHPMAAGEEVVVATVETGDEEDDEAYEDSHKTGEYSYGKKKNRFLFILIGMFVVLLLGSLGAYTLYKSNLASTLAKVEDEFNKAFSNRRWEEAATKGRAFLEQNKDASKSKAIEFKVGFAELQNKLAPGQLSSQENIKKAISTLTGFQKANQTSPQYKDLRKEMAEAAYTLVKTGSEYLEKSPDNAVLTELQPVLAMADTLRGGLPDNGSELGAMPEDAAAKYKAAESSVAANVAKQNWLGEYQQVLEQQRLGSIDAVLTGERELVRLHPSLAKDPELAEKIAELKRTEPTWVKFRGENPPMAPAKVSFGKSIRICPPVKKPEGVEDDDGVVLAMARGTLYGLSAKTGEDRWALRVGQDLRDLPPRVTLGDQVDFAFVVTTEDEGKTFLSSMNVKTGERNWRRQLPGACPAGATLISGNRLLAVPMKDAQGNGLVALVETATGKQTAEFVIPGYDISTAPAYDKSRDRLFVPVDRGRVFALDLANKRCSAVVYSEHGAGQMRAAPVIIDTALIVCVASGAGLGTTKVKAFDIGTETPTPLGEITLEGHVTTTPYVSGDDTVGIVTDNGFLTLLGIGKTGAPATATGSTPVYVLASPAEDKSTKMQLKIELGSELKADQPKPHVQVAHAALNDWWVFSHDHLIFNVYDPFHKRLVPSPFKALPLGYPLHRAEVSPDNRVVIVVTQARGDARVVASAIQRATGETLWQRQLGTEASQDPVTVADDVAMLDRGGAIFFVKAAEVNEGDGWQRVGSWPGLPLAAASHRLVKSPNGHVLVGVSFNPTRARMIVRRIDLKAGGTAVTKEFPHTFAPVGTPAAFDDGTVYVPCKDGNIYQFNLATGVSGSLFTWRDPVAPANAEGHLVLMTPSLLLATNGMNKIYRWDRSAQTGSWRRNSNDIEISARITTDLCKLPDGKVAVGDSAGNLHCLTLAGLGMAKQWNVQGSITKGPFPVGAAGLGCVVDGRRVWWVNSPDEDAGKKFAADDVAAVVGEGTMVGNDLLLAVLRRDKELGMVAQYVWLDPVTGRPQHTERLPVGLAPASSPAPLGKDRAFAPLTDGTVRILRKSGQDTAANPRD